MSEKREGEKERKGGVREKDKELFRAPRAPRFRSFFLLFFVVLLFSPLSRHRLLFFRSFAFPTRCGQGRLCANSDGEEEEGNEAAGHLWKKASWVSFGGKKGLSKKKGRE